MIRLSVNFCVEHRVCMIKLNVDFSVETLSLYDLAECRFWYREIESVLLD